VTGAISATLSVNFLESVIKGVRFAADSALEEDGFELVVPLPKRTAVPSSPFGFPVDGTGYDRP